MPPSRPTNATAPVSTWWQGPFSSAGHAPCRLWPGQGAFLDNPYLLRVRELLASTEALFAEVATRLAEARRLQDQARALHIQCPWRPPSAPATPRPRRPAWGGRAVLVGREAVLLSCLLGGPAGPFATLDEALEARLLLHDNGTTVRIDCSRLTARELADRLTCGGEAWPVRVKEEWLGYNLEPGRWEWRPDGG